MKGPSSPSILAVNLSFFFLKIIRFGFWCLHFLILTDIEFNSFKKSILFYEKVNLIQTQYLLTDRVC